MELPPRARRILRGTRACDRTTGTTSACAENTLRNWPLDTQLRNYLRVRGEYLTGVNINMLSVELPPRARRIRLSPLPPDPRVGTTSACAENTGVAIYRVALWGNYLRVRGEYCRFPLVWFPTLELPPRARRIHFQAPCPTVRRGTTSACAENTRLLTVNRAKNWNYLRVRGEYYHPRPHTPYPQELPPRARRIH